MMFPPWLHWAGLWRGFPAPYLSALGSLNGESIPIGQLRVYRVFWSWGCSMQCAVCEPWECVAWEGM